jgi:DNA-binding LacI/PurR family transcriptional regulator
MLMLNKFEQIGFSCYVVNFSKNCDVQPRVRDLIDRGVERFVLMGPIWGGNPEEEKDKYQELFALIERKNCTFINYGDSKERRVMQDFAPAVTATVDFFRKHGVENFKMMLPDSGSNREQALCSCFPDLTAGEVRKKYIYPQGDIFSWNTIEDMVKAGYCETEKLLANYPDTQAIYFLSDQFALGGIRFMVDHGITPGKDILVAGFNDFPGARYCGYPISTAAHNLEKLATALVEESGKSSPCSIKIAPEIILRDKIAPII